MPINITRGLNQMRFLQQIDIKSGVVKILILGGIVLISLTIFRIISQASDRYQQIVAEKQELDELKQEEANLTRALQYYSSLEYIELQSRDYLNLYYEGESIVIVPKEVNENVSKSGSEDDISDQKWEVEPSIELWLELLQ